MDSESKNAETYDFVHPEHKIKSDWPVLNLITKKLAIDLETRLITQFQFPVTVSAVDANISKLNELFTDEIDSRILFEVSLPPFSGTAWLFIDRALVYALADTFFGGKGEPTEKELDPVLSQTEERLCQYFNNCLKESLPCAWSMILELQESGVERISADRLKHSSDDQVVAICECEVNIAGTDHKLQLIYPHIMLGPYEKKLQKMKQQSTAVANGFSGALKEELMNCEIDMHAVLAETKISLAEFLELKPGDFIPLRKIEDVSFKSSSKALFNARVGTSNGQVSAKLSRWCAPGRS